MSLARGVIDRLCHSRASIQSALARRLLLDHLSNSKSPRYPVLLRFFSRSQPVKGLADAQRSIQKTTDKFTKTEKLCRVACTALALGTVAYQSLPNTLLIGQMQSIYQSFSKGQPMRVTPELKALILEVLEEVADKDDVGQVKANAFIGISPEPWLWGNLRGAFQLMLPPTMNYRTQKEFNLYEYQFGGRTEDSPKLSYDQMESEVVAAFKQSVLLTENAKKFIIARELERGRSDLPSKLSMLTALNMVTGHVFYTRFVAKYGPSPASPVLMRKVFLVAVVLSFIGLTAIQFDFFRKKNDREIDRAACSHGSDYAKGGVEYYSKVMSRNAALRTLMPNEKGKKLYNLKGEKYPGVFRRKHVPFQERRDICNQVLDGYSSSQ